MASSTASLLMCVAGLASLETGAEFSLGEPAFSLNSSRVAPTQGYAPQPGDIALFTTAGPVWRSLYYLALSGPPTHSALVVRMPDGELGLLEAGVDFNPRVGFTPLSTRLRGYWGPIFVRSRKTPLSEESSAQLTEFAGMVRRKRASILRFVAQMTPLRMRGPIRTEYIGKSQGIHETYTCSEMVVEALVFANVLDKETARPAATYPRDLFFDESTNPYLNEHLIPALKVGWNPPAALVK